MDSIQTLVADFLSLFHDAQSARLVRSINPSNFSEIFSLLIILVTSLSYISRGLLWDRPDPCYGKYFERPQEISGGAKDSPAGSRDISKILKDGNFRCVVFWGSQSGTSERLGEQLAHELQACFGIKTLAADLSDYDAATIARISRKCFVFFILSTYGEGDPSDNTAGLWNWIKTIDNGGVPVDNLQYCALGLGNSNYRYYNHVVDVVTDALNNAGARPFIPCQKADDANSGTEEDFESWKDDVFAHFRSLGYEQSMTAYKPTLIVSFDEQTDDSPRSFPSPSYNHERSSTTSHIVPLPIKSARELFEIGERNCVHLELDLNNCDLVYKTGDHIAIWAENPEAEIDRLLHALGLQSRRSTKICIEALAANTKLKLPSTTTLEQILRHSLDICGPVSRKVAQELAQFAPTKETKSTLTRICQDRKSYEAFMSTTHVTLGRLLQFVSPSQAWTDLPLPFVLERLLPLQPRYYSISSSSVVSPRRIAVTALVVNKDTSAGKIPGLASNYLLASANLPAAGGLPAPSYSSIIDDRNMVYAHVRKTKFKLPVMSSTPLVMICAGTGLAPFRAFIQERARLHNIGKPCGKMLLIFGCRNENDFIYREELEKLQAQLGDNLEIVKAFSRATTSKMYVQDRVAEKGQRIVALLESGANMYICGQAAMAREVDQKLEAVAAKLHNITDEGVKAWADGFKRRGKWKADVWG